MHALKCLCVTAALSLSGSSLASDPAPRFAMARALGAGAPEVAAPDLEGGVSQVTVTAAGAIGVLD